jgi:hypothetical protein
MKGSVIATNGYNAAMAVLADSGADSGGDSEATN